MRFLSHFFFLMTRKKENGSFQEREDFLVQRLLFIRFDFDLKISTKIKKTFRSKRIKTMNQLLLHFDESFDEYSSKILT